MIGAFFVAAGTADAGNLWVESSPGAGFAPGQTMWISSIYKATRVSGSNALTYRSQIRWLNAAGALISTSTSDLTINATIGETLAKFAHVAPAGAVQARIRFTAIPTGGTMQHDLTFHSCRLTTEEPGATGVVIDPPTDVIIYADSTGTVKAGELPRQVGITASSGTANVTTLGTWSRTVTAGITCTIGPSTGIVEITELTAADVLVPISFSYAGVARTAKLHVVRRDDPPTNSGGGGGGGGSGTSASTTTLANATTTSYGTGVSSTMTVKPGSNGQIACSAPIDFKRTPGTASGTTGAFGKFQYRAAGSPTWIDAGTEVASTTSAATEANPGDPTLNFAGSINVSQTISGLTAGADYEVRFIWRLSIDDGNDIYRVSGTIEAVGS